MAVARRSSGFLEEDRLLAALLEGPMLSREVKRGSFGTVGGRRRRRDRQLVTRLLVGEQGLLEDQSPAMVELLLAGTHRWHFSAFLLDRFSGGRSLSTLCLHLFHRSGQSATYQIRTNYITLITFVASSNIAKLLDIHG